MAISSERMKASPQRVQDILNRYNLNNLKLTMNSKIANKKASRVSNGYQSIEGSLSYQIAPN